MKREVDRRKTGQEKAQKSKGKKRPKAWHRGQNAAARWMSNTGQLPQVLNDPLIHLQESSRPVRKSGRGADHV